MSGRKRSGTSRQHRAFDARAGDGAREALRHAASRPSPDPGRILDAVPALLAEAHRRRRAESAPDRLIVAAARLWVPRLTAATALLVIVAFLWPRGPSQTASSPGAATAVTEASFESSLDAWVVTGSAPSQVSDPVLKALVR